MKVRFLRNKGHRVMKGTVKIPHHENRTPVFGGLENVDNHYLDWCPELNKWIPMSERNNYENGISLFSVNHKIRSVRAAIRHIKKHNEIPKGTTMRLVSYFVGCDVEITK